MLPPDVFGPHPTTDGGFFHLDGVPLVNFLTAPFYLFDAMDTLDKIHRPSLVPVTRAAVAHRRVDGGRLRHGDAGEVRLGRLPPGRRGARAGLRDRAAQLAGRQRSFSRSVSTALAELGAAAQVLVRHLAVLERHLDGREARCRSAPPAAS